MRCRFCHHRLPLTKRFCPYCYAPNRLFNVTLVAGVLIVCGGLGLAYYGPVLSLMFDVIEAYWKLK